MPNKSTEFVNASEMLVWVRGNSDILPVVSLFQFMEIIVCDTDDLAAALYSRAMTCTTSCASY